MVILLKDWFYGQYSTVNPIDQTGVFGPYQSDMNNVPMGWDSAHGVWFGGPRRLDSPRIPPTFFSLMKNSIYVIII